MKEGKILILGIGCLVAFVILIIALALFLTGVTHLGMNVSTGGSGGDLTEGSLGFPTGASTQQAAICLNNYIKSVSPTSPLNGKAERIIASGKAGSVNPALLVAIGQQESDLGTTGGGVSKNNYYGRMTEDSGLMSYASWDEAINEQGPYMKRMYFDDRLTTIPQIGSRYAPIGAKNDSNNLNKNWVPGVTSAYSAITTRCPEFNTLTNYASTICGQKIFEIAQQYIGLKYAWGSGGGNPPGRQGALMGLDCSGYASRVYDEAGLTSGRWTTAAMPSIQGLQKISKVAAQPGGLVRLGYINGREMPSASGRGQGHVVIFEKFNSNGTISIYESTKSHGVRHNANFRPFGDLEFYHATKCNK